MILKIRQVGEPVLRQTARPLTAVEILDDAIQELIEWMRSTMRDAPGVGLAAPQIGVPLQLVVIEDPPEYIGKVTPEEAAERDRHPVPFQVLINPAITIDSGEPAEFFEGCLSVAGFTALVPRARKFHVECLNERAEPVVIDGKGWYARILQHEIDHLNGVLYIDRMVAKSFATIENYGRFRKHRSDKK